VNHDEAKNMTTATKTAEQAQTGTTSSKSDLATHLAIERTRVAYDRTMMAWTRTSAALISFGFTIYKFFQIELKSDGQTGQVMGPRGFGLTLVCIGLFSLLLAAIENRRSLQQLEGVRFPLSMATIQAAIIAVLGIVALVAIVLRG
jgi:putative membrane protein